MRDESSQTTAEGRALGNLPRASVRLLVALLLGALSTALSTGAAAASASTRADPFFDAECRTAGTTLRDTRRVRIFQDKGLYLACLKGPRLAGDLYVFDDDVGRFSGVSTVAGNWVAVRSESNSSQGDDSATVATNLRTHEFEPNLPAADALAIRANGDLVTANFNPATSQTTISLLRRRPAPPRGWRRPQVLDRYAAVVASSLSRDARGRISWRHGVARRYAPVTASECPFTSPCVIVSPAVREPASPGTVQTFRGIGWKPRSRV